VRNKTVPLTFVNSAFLQSLDPDLGFLNLPFTITDQLMAKPGVAEGILALVRSYVEPRGLKVFAVMRGADTIVIFKNRQVRTPDDMKGLRIRVAGPGVYQDIVRSLGAAPVVFRRSRWARPSRAGRWTASSPRPAAGGRTCRTRRARASFRACCSIRIF
jgi:C4-dicarboxylate-binding protein DctP